MIYNTDGSLKIIERFSEELKTDIKTVSIDLYSTNAEYDNGSEITIYSVNNVIDKIALESGNILIGERTTINFSHLSEQEKTFSITSHETKKDDLYYRTTSGVFFSNPNYTNAMSISSDSNTTNSKLMGYFELSSNKSKNNHRGSYYESLNTGDIHTFTNKLTCDVTGDASKYLNEIVDYIRELKKKYKNSSWDIDDVVRMVFLKRKTDKHLQNHFEELSVLTGVKEKIKRLQKNV